MPIHHFLPCVSLRFSRQEVTNGYVVFVEMLKKRVLILVICYFFANFAIKLT